MKEEDKYTGFEVCPLTDKYVSLEEDCKQCSNFLPTDPIHRCRILRDNADRLSAYKRRSGRIF